MDVIRKDATITNTTEDFPGSFEVILSAPTKDRDGDTLLPDEWKMPLPDHITFDSDHGMTVATTVGSGVPRIDEETGNLVVAGSYSSLPRAQEVRTLVNEGHIRTTSVAYMTEKTQKDGKSVAQRELLNGAFVAIPSNREALVLASKGVKAGARNSAGDLAGIQSIHDTATALGADCAPMKSADAARTNPGQAWLQENAAAATKGRLNAAKAALVATGYFTAEQVGDDIAPRIIEMSSALGAKGAGRKSVAGSLEATQDRVRDALEDAYPDNYAWLRATLPDYIVFELSAIDGPDSDTFKQSYTDDGAVVTLTGDRTPVDMTEVVVPDPDEDESADPAVSSAAAPAKAAAPAETKAAEDESLQMRVHAMSLIASSYTD
jgi:hypothetical protein